MIKVLIFIIIMGALVGFFWFDEIKIWVDENQQKAEEQLPDLINQGASTAQNWWETQGKDWADNLVANLTSQGKAQIDDWLQQQGLNEYGDQEGTMYTGGTPLFNESTGETIERYAYLLQKFPDLIQGLNLEQYLK